MTTADRRRVVDRVKANAMRNESTAPLASGPVRSTPGGRQG
jgi:hypothetical protein